MIIESLEYLLPTKIFENLKRVDENLIQELKFRNNAPIIIQYNNKRKFMLDNGLNKIICDEKLLNYILLKASNYSLYKVENQIKNGYIMFENGIRIGIAGEFIYDNGNIGKLQSITIRIPHEINNCSKKIFNLLFKEDEFLNTIILSSPGLGKTTLLRDIIYQIEKSDKMLNLSIIDERNEITAIKNGIPTLSIGKCCDIVAYMDKKSAIEYCIRSLNPDIIVTDEISLEKDIEVINLASTMGIKILCTIHCDSLYLLKLKANMNKLIEEKLFRRYILLTKNSKIGFIEGVYNQNFDKLWGEI